MRFAFALGSSGSDMTSLSCTHSAAHFNRPTAIPCTGKKEKTNANMIPANVSEAPNPRGIVAAINVVTISPSHSQQGVAGGRGKGA